MVMKTAGSPISRNPSVFSMKVTNAGTGLVMSRRCRMRMNRKDQCIIIAAPTRAWSVRYTRRRPSTNSSLGIPQERAEEEHLEGHSSRRLEAGVGVLEACCAGSSPGTSAGRRWWESGRARAVGPPPDLHHHSDQEEHESHRGNHDPEEPPHTGSSLPDNPTRKRPPTAARATSMFIGDPLVARCRTWRSVNPD